MRSGSAAPVADARHRGPAPATTRQHAAGADSSAAVSGRADRPAAAQSARPHAGRRLLPPPCRSSAGCRRPSARSRRRYGQAVASIEDQRDVIRASADGQHVERAQNVGAGCVNEQGHLLGRVAAAAAGSRRAAATASASAAGDRDVQLRRGGRRSGRRRSASHRRG